MKKLLTFIINSPSFKISLIFSIIIISLFELLTIYLFINIFTSQIKSDYLLYLCIFIFLLNIIVQNLGIKLFSYIAFQIVSEKFNDLFSKIINCRQFVKISDERINKLFGIEFIRLSERLVLPALNGFAKLTSALFIATFIILKDPFLILAFIFTLTPIYILLFVIARPRIRKFDYMIEKTINKIYEDVEFASIYKVEILVYKLQKKIKENFSFNQKKYVDNNSELVRLSALPRPIIEGSIFITLTFIIALFNNFDLSVFAILGLGALKILPSLQTIFASSSLILGNISALDEYYFVDDLCNKYINKNKFKTNKIKKIDKYWKTITIRNINSKTTRRINFDLKDIEIKRGQKIVICGESGIGKTTFLNCISGLELDTNIEINIDKKIYTPTELMNSNFISYLKQNALIFKGSLEDNLTLYREFDKEYLYSLLKKMGLYEKDGSVMDLKKELLNRGANLSVGQMQRVAFIRTLLFKRPLFILDEPTSSVDETIRDLMWDELSNDKNCTVICVTHDTNLKRKFDKQIIL